MTTLLVFRDAFGPEATLSTWYIDGVRQCFGIEDAVRPEKIAGKTAIPAGQYQLVIRKNGGFHKEYAADPRFRDIHRGMIEVAGVPGFSDILIHVGNSAADTRGCLLPGSERNERLWGVMESARAYRSLYRRIVGPVAAGAAKIRIVESAREN